MNSRNTEKIEQRKKEACKRNYAKMIGIEKVVSPVYLLVTLIYAILIFNGYNQIVIDFIVSQIEITEILIIISILMALSFLAIFQYCYKRGKFGIVFHFFNITFSIISANLGFVYYLSKNFELTPIQTFNIFFYLITVSLCISIFSYFVLKIAIAQKCNPKQKSQTQNNNKI